jgi:hypothetical protein
MTKLHLVEHDNETFEQVHIERSPWPRIPRVVQTKPSLLSKVYEFASVYLLYRKQHGRRYSLRIAYGIAFNGLPF